MNRSSAVVKVGFSRAEGARLEMLARWGDCPLDQALRVLALEHLRSLEDVELERAIASRVRPVAGSAAEATKRRNLPETLRASLAPEAEAELRGLPTSTQKTILKAMVRAFSSNPDSFASPLSGVLRKPWRLDVADYCVIFEWQLKERWASVLSIHPLKELYRILGPRLHEIAGIEGFFA